MDTTQSYADLGTTGNECLEDAVHVWIAHTARMDDASLSARYREILTEEERRCERRFRFEKDQRLFLLARALSRTVLSRYHDVQPEDWRFVRNSYGRPGLSPDHGIEHFSFNLSHCDGLVVLAVSNQKVGVDVERLMRDKVSLEIADQWFSPKEIAHLRALPCEEQVARFFEYWTLKESYIKAVGMGLSLPLNVFGFDLTRTGRVQVHFDSSLTDDAERWCFWLIRVASSHLTAICAHRDPQSGADLRLRIRTVLPLVETERESGEDCVILRTSRAHS